MIHFRCFRGVKIGRKSNLEQFDAIAGGNPYEPPPAYKVDLLKGLASKDRTPKWVTDDAASETAQFAEIIMRRFCAQEDAWKQAPMSWLCLCCRVEGLLIRRTGVLAKR